MAIIIQNHFEKIEKVEQVNFCFTVAFENIKPFYLPYLSMIELTFILLMFSFFVP